MTLLTLRSVGTAQGLRPTKWIVYTFANHTESETIYEWVAVVIGVAGVLIALILHHPWGWLLWLVSLAISVPIGIRAIKRRSGPPA